jgi:hypothetical protein
MGEGPPASEALGEFGDGVKRKQSGEVLGVSGFGLSGGGGKAEAGGAGGGRSRGGSLGRDSRLYGDETGNKDQGWGVEVEGVRVGEVSALSGEGEFELLVKLRRVLIDLGVEALFKAISSLLVDKKDKIEKERTLRRKGSVMLVDTAAEDGVLKETKTRGGCC